MLKIKQNMQILFFGMIDDLERAITSVKCVSHNEGNLNSFIILGRFVWVRKSTGIFAWYRFNYIAEKFYF